MKYFLFLLIIFQILINETNDAQSTITGGGDIKLDGFSPSVTFGDDFTFEDGTFTTMKHSNDRFSITSSVKTLVSGGGLLIQNRPQLGIDFEGVSLFNGVKIFDGMDASLTSDGYLLIGDKFDLNIAIDNNEILARNNGAVSDLNLNAEGGRVRIGQHTPNGTDSQLNIRHGEGMSTNGLFIGRSTEVIEPSENWHMYVFSQGNLGFIENGNHKRTLEEDGDFVNASDRRLKKNVQYLNSELESLLQLRPATYQYKKQKDNEMQFGFIAQEVQEIYPDLVSVVNEESEDKMLGINYEEFIPLLVMGIQEQQAIIEEKEVEIEALKARLNKIEALLFNNDNRIGEATMSQTTIITNAQLYPNQPNPFSKSTTIRYFIPEIVKQATLQITNSNGKVLKVIPIDARGEGQSVLQAQSLRAGTYFYTLILDGQVLETKQMILTK